jgi:hypothetical protein
MDLTFIQARHARHIAEILYLQYFYLMVYSDDGQLTACSPRDLLNLGEICLNAPQYQQPDLSAGEK